MVQLSGTGLGQRQHELNTKVNKLTADNVSFEDVASVKETSDVDRLFKIDVAAKYKNLEYVIATLKSGDSLYISRVLKKCPWLFEDEYSSTLNTDYLHHNIFPFMSIKMKKKFLSAIATNLKNCDRAAGFYNYCSQIKMGGLANKFLINTSETFKISVLKEAKNTADVFVIDEKYEMLRSFFGNSFVLFEACLENGTITNIILNECSYLYTVSDVKYLDLLEKHVCLKSYTKVKLGLRISKHILTNHKQRVLANPTLYVKILNMNKVIRHSTLSDLKAYAVGLLPADVSEFWTMEYYKNYKSILDAIPEDERFTFVENIFNEKYPNQEFDMLKTFYDQGYYNLMTKAQRQSWALRHIDSNKEILGSGLNYRWYKYVSFEKAFGAIKKMIMTATDYKKRLELLKVLAHTAQLELELETLLNYFLERHVNESKNSKELFLRSIISTHNVFELNMNCWGTLNKLFHSIGAYDMGDRCCNPEFRIIAILYNILNDIKMPDALKKYLECEMSMYSTKKYITEMSDENKRRIYDYICNFYIDCIKGFSPGTKDDKCIAYIHFLLEFLATYNKTQEDIPDIVMEFINHDFDTFKYQQILGKNNQTKLVDANDLMRFLKKDSQLVADRIADVKEQINDMWNFRLNSLLKKIRIYFTGEVVYEKFVQLFNESLNVEHLDHRTAAAAVYGLFQLCDEKSKISFMNKFAPEKSKIYENEVDDNILRTQEAICRFSCYSRPPMPLENTLMYLKGDYVKFCLPMFDMYLANLPQHECLKFAEALIDAPVSIQKHGLRLSFKCFSSEHLRTLVLNTWKKTKNVSVRGVIYKAFFDKTIELSDTLMFETLKELTLELHEEDEEELFPKLTSGTLPNEIAGEFIEAVWEVVGMFKNNERNISRKIDVIKSIDNIIYLVKKEFLKKICNDHLAEMFCKTKTPGALSNDASLHRAKWNLIAHYIVYFTNNDDDRCESTEMARCIVRNLIEGWNDVVSDVYVNRQLLADFINNLKKLYTLRHPTHAPTIIADTKSYVNAVIVLETILGDLQKALPLSEIYNFVWDLKISIINRQVLKQTVAEYEKSSRVEVIEDSATIFGCLLGQLVQGFVQNKTYFTFFTNEVVTLIDDAAWCMMSYLKVLNEDVDFDKDHFLVGIARGLLEVKILEANLLALQLLPIEPNCNLDVYKSVYTAIRKLKDVEVQFCLNKKYSEDFKRRRYE